jgi:hypothetical protein
MPSCSLHIPAILLTEALSMVCSEYMDALYYIPVQSKGVRTSICRAV